MHTKRGPFSRYLAALAAKFIEAGPLFAIFGRASGQILVKMRVLARQGHYPSCNFESVDFPDIQKVETLILMILGLKPTFFVIFGR